MYFGYEAMWTLTFVPIAFVLVMAVGSALALVYVVGASRGGRAGRRYVRVCMYLLGAGIVADVVYGVASGQFETFLRSYGWLPLVEMGFLGFMFIGSMWIMAMSYLSGKKD